MTTKTKTTTKKKPTNRAAQDTTLINKRATDKRIAALEARVTTIEERLGK